MQLVKGFVFAGIILFAMTVLSALDSLAVAAENDAQINKIEEQAIPIKNPASDLWRAVRQREFDDAGSFNSKTPIKSPNADTLINTEAYQWRKLRREQVIPYSTYFLLGVIALIAFLTLMIRRKKIPNGRSGKQVARMTSIQRISHWLMALLVGFMALSGLILLLGRSVIIPLIGIDAFSPIASASKEGHNLFGPLMIISILMMLVYFIRHNLPALIDFKWLLTAGGLFTKKHLKVGYFNAGEKILFWATILLGLVLSVTGLILLFPYYEETLNLAQLALIIHVIAALLLIALTFGHIWMVRTVEGTLEAMTTGSVDENWAKSHHSEWYKTVSDHSAAETKTMDADQKGAYE